MESQIQFNKSNIHIRQVHQAIQSEIKTQQKNDLLKNIILGRVGWVFSETDV